MGTRCGKELRKALDTGDELETVRAAAKEAGHECHLRSGARIFVYPEQYRSILAVLPDTELRAHHVVICEAFLPLLYKDIAKIPSKCNVRPSQEKLFALVDHSSAETVCVVVRTFCSTTNPQFRSAASVS